MHRTKNDLPEATRQKVGELLNSRLADCIDLSYQAKQAHWNVKGRDFIALHELFDKLHTEVEGYVDMIAERIVQLGGTALGTIRAAAKKSALPEYPLTISDGKDHVEALTTALSTFAKLVRQAIDQAQELRDADTTDVFTEVSRGIDKQLWFIEAHLEGK